ncbi:MAG: hypothetical protein RR633_09015 [Acinetobacter sp.]
MGQQESFSNRLIFSTAVTVCTWFLIGIGYCNFFVHDWEPVFSILALFFISLIYFVYFFFKTGQAWQILSGFLITFIIMALCMAVPVIGWIALLLFVLYNISKALDSIKNLLPNAIYAMILYFLLFTAESHVIDTDLAMMLYISVVFIFSYNLNKEKLPAEMVYLRYSILFLSIPLIILSIMAIFSALRNLFNVSVFSQDIKVQSPQQVSGYTKTSGVDVAAYTRNVTQTMTQTTTNVTAGSGAMTSSLVKNFAETTDNLSNQDNYSTKQIQRSKPETKLFNLPETNNDHHFYRHDDLNKKKVLNFISKVKTMNDMPSLSLEHIVCYFDETIFGKGDNGVVLTNEAVYCLNTFGDENFYIKLSDILDLNISGSLNKKLTFETNSRKFEVTLTQSNKGVENLYQSINLYK